MKTAVLPALLAAVLAAPPPSPAQTEPPRDPELAQGVSELKSGDFETAVLTLDRVVRRLAPRPEARRDLIEARVRLGVAYVGLGQSEAARAQFKEAVLLDPALRLDAEDFSPKVLAAFEAARREVPAAATTPAASPTPRPPVRSVSASPSPSPAAARKKGSKTPLIIAGVAGAGALAALAAAGGGKEPAPAPTPVPACSGAGQVGLSNARWETTSYACPDGASSLTHSANVLVDVSARGCALTITGAQVLTTVITAFRTTNTAGEQWVATGLAATPGSVSNTTATVRVTHTLTCSNTPGPSDAFNDYQATVTLVTSAGSFSASSTVPFRVSFP